MIFIDDEILKVITIATDLFSGYSNSIDKQGGKLDPTEPFISTTISGSISKYIIICCKNDFQPFVKIAFFLVTTDLVSSPILFDEGKSFLITTGSKRVNVYDLSNAGKAYDQVITGGDIFLNDDEEANDSFHLKIAISNSGEKIPSELLLVFHESKFLILRRFVNELLQYFFSANHGIGRILSQCKSDDIEEEPMHPLRFQIHINHSTIILPRSSEGDDLIGFTASKLILSNSYEECSWPNPHLCEEDGDFEFSPEDDHDHSNYFNNIGNDFFDTIDSNNDSNTDKIFDYLPFNESWIFRINVTATNINAYTGISKESFLKDQERRRKFQAMKNVLSFNEVVDSNFVFAVNNDELPGEIDSHFLSHLAERKWEKVTTKPISLEVMSDFLPSHLRVLIKDIHSQGGLIDREVCPFNVDLRMSQFYAILSTWYENMQELPVLFPYTSEFIYSAVKAPVFPDDWPGYGTESYVKRISCPNKLTFEIALCLHEVEWKCQFDNPQYYEKKVKCAFMMDSNDDAISLHFKNLIIQVDMNTEGVMRTRLGATSCTVFDKRRSQTVFHRAFETSQLKKYNVGASLNMEWGLRCGRTISSEELNFPFQATVFMTPDKWCLVNLALEDLDTCTADLAFIWILVEYFSSYYTNEMFGSPYFAMKQESENFLRQSYNNVKPDDSDECLNLDFRLWLLRPRVIIPSNPIDKSAPAFIIKSLDHGLFYRYKTIGYDFVSQEICSRNLDIMRAKSCDVLNTNVRDVVSSGKRVTMLVRSLNLAILYDQNKKSNHIDIHVNVSQTTDEDETITGIEFSPIRVKPVEIPLPKVCKPSFIPSQHLGPISCEIDLMSPEHFIMASKSFLTFGGPYEEEEVDIGPLSNEEQDIKDCIDDSGASFSVFVNTRGLKVFISDPLLGVHLPIVVVNVPDIKFHCSQLRHLADQGRETSNSTDLQACVDAHFWADYCKSGPTRSWEPLIEPYKCIILFEKSMRRGHGITVTSECPLHFSTSGAFFETLAFAARSFAPHIRNLLGIHNTEDSTTPERQKKVYI